MTFTHYQRITISPNGLEEMAEAKKIAKAVEDMGHTPKLSEHGTTAITVEWWNSFMRGTE